EYDGPTITDGKYTSLEYFPSSANRFVQNVQEQNSRSHLFFVIPQKRLQVAAYSQTIESTSKVLHQPHFVQNALLDGSAFQYQKEHRPFVTLLQLLCDIRNGPCLHIYQHSRSSFHLRASQALVLSDGALLFQNHLDHEPVYFSLRQIQTPYLHNHQLQSRSRVLQSAK